MKEVLFKLGAVLLVTAAMLYAWNHEDIARFAAAHAAARTVEDQRVQEKIALLSPQLEKLQFNDFVLTDEGWWMVKAANPDYLDFDGCNLCSSQTLPMNRFAPHVERIVRRGDADYDTAAKQFLFRERP